MIFNHVVVVGGGSVVIVIVDAVFKGSAANNVVAQVVPFHACF